MMNRMADQSYYCRREAQERAQAERSDDADARRVHLDMAARYAQLLNASAA